ncbi:hypothetical protein C8Q77DRAFT_1151060 [Trametes polyzona]|nr:hypothetical protein C8Q77DRAFT_1151060 [Trametes polyzona]
MVRQQLPLLSSRNPSTSHARAFVMVYTTEADRLPSVTPYDGGYRLLFTITISVTFPGKLDSTASTFWPARTTAYPERTRDQLSPYLATPTPPTSAAPSSLTTSHPNPPPDPAVVEIGTAAIVVFVAVSILITTLCVLCRWHRTRRIALKKCRAGRDVEARIDQFQTFCEKPLEEDSRRFSYDGSVIHIRPETPCSRYTHTTNPLPYVSRAAPKLPTYSRGSRVADRGSWAESEGTAC